jgi:GT2 family glycosyltransferase
MNKGKAMHQSVAAIVLAFSRMDEVKMVVDHLKNQTRPVDEIIVIFQGTNPDILAWLQAQSGITLRVQGNVGTAGGFTSGMRYARDQGHHWCWLFDDDAVPELNALEEMAKTPYFDYTQTGYLAAVVMNPQREVYMSPIAGDEDEWYDKVMDDGCVPTTGATWIGCMVSVQSLAECGMPMEAYFMYDEDFEYTSRVSLVRKSYCVLKSITIHYQKGYFDPFKSKVDMLKHGYYVRNHFATIRLSNRTLPKKIFRIWLWFFKNLWEIVTRKVPLKTLGPLFSGLLFFRPKVKFD